MNAGSYMVLRSDVRFAYDTLLRSFFPIQVGQGDVAYQWIERMNKQPTALKGWAESHARKEGFVAAAARFSPLKKYGQLNVHEKAQFWHFYWRRVVRIIRETYTKLPRQFKNMVRPYLKYYMAAVIEGRRNAALAEIAETL